MYQQLQLLPAPARGRLGRIAGWTRSDTPTLWLQWRSQFDSDDEAIATAVWMGNRLVKDKAKGTRATFYSLKDAFIDRYGCEGRRAREEVRTCRRCDGSGDDGWGYCDRCEGTGIWSSRWLYLHEFTVAGQRYSLHSYHTPKVLLEGESANLERYGGRFTRTELAALGLPFSGLLKVLGYVAVKRWGMVNMGGRYV